MPRKILKKYLPHPKHIKNNKYLKVFGTLLHNPQLWHFNRNSIATAFAVGLFCAWIPIPFQMMLAAGLGILMHANLPVSVALVWLTNPITMAPMFYIAYKLGAFTLGVGEIPFKMELTTDWLIHGTLLIWKPFLLGCVMMGSISAIVGYIGIHTFWRWAVIRRWQQRKHGRTPRK